VETKRPTNPAAEEILGQYFPVLDHGFVALVDYMGTDESIERAARVSYGYGTRKSSQTRGLIRYLRRHRHTTPSEMVELKFHCAMPMFVARQWIRHRTANVNEYSGRYSLMPLLFYTPAAADFALQSKQNNQGRAGERRRRHCTAKASRAGNGCGATPRRRTAGCREDVARELARIDLPLSTYTQWYWKIDLHNLLHFLTLRVDPHAQYEIRAYAEVMAGMVRRVAPLSYEAWIDYDLGGAHFSRGELAALRALLDVDGTGIATRAGRCPRQCRPRGARPLCARGPRVHRQAAAHGSAGLRARSVAHETCPRDRGVDGPRRSACRPSADRMTAGGAGGTAA
jgi:thymidylate synthase (FAD)